MTNIQNTNEDSLPDYGSDVCTGNIYPSIEDREGSVGESCNPEDMEEDGNYDEYWLVYYLIQL